MAPRFPCPGRHAQSVNVMGHISCFVAKVQWFCRCPSSADFKLVTGEIIQDEPFRRCLEVREIWNSSWCPLAGLEKQTAMLRRQPHGREWKVTSRSWGLQSYNCKKLNFTNNSLNLVEDWGFRWDPSHDQYLDFSLVRPWAADRTNLCLDTYAIETGRWHIYVVWSH